jgi:hypothetical protein
MLFFLWASLRIARYFVGKVVEIGDLARHSVNDAADIGDEALNVGETAGLNHCPGPASKRLKILREKDQLPHHRLSPLAMLIARRASASWSSRHTSTQSTWEPVIVVDQLDPHFDPNTIGRRLQRQRSSG